MHSSSYSATNPGLGGLVRAWGPLRRSQFFKTWRRARPALRTACRWGTRSSSCHIWCRLPCDHIPAARSRWWRPCRCDTSFHRPPAELWHHLRRGIWVPFFSYSASLAGSLNCTELCDVAQFDSSHWRPRVTNITMAFRYNSLLIPFKTFPIYNFFNQI